MKLNIKRETLLHPLQMVIGVVERKQTLPILSNVLINTNNDQLTITGTDLEVELVGISALDSSSDEASLTLPGRKLMDICKALPDDAPIELYQDKQRMVLKSGRSKFVLSTLPPKDFPNVEEHEGQLSFSVAQNKLKHALQQTAFSMAQQDVRYYLNGMLWEVGACTLKTVATDGHRLASNLIDAKIDKNHKIQVIVPRKGVLELMRLLEDTETPVDVTLGNNHIRVSGSNYVFTSKLIDGRFPDYERVIPKKGDKILLLNRNELKLALQRTAILCNEKFHGVRFELTKGLLRLVANNPEQEAAEEEIVLDYDGENLDIGFNVNYLLDILNCLQQEHVRITLSDAGSSIRIEDPDKQGDSIFVAMPMRL